MTGPSTALLSRVAAQTMRWNFRLWGFGEAIALRGLLAVTEATGDVEPRAFVHALLRAWLGRGVARSFEDHVGPGRELVAMHALTGDAALLDAARALAAMHASMPVGECGARCHRPDQPGWRHQIWVDCMDVDGPFLVALAAATGVEAFFDQAVNEALGYARTLQDPSGLLRHGHERFAGRNGALWARGQGWALMGLVDTLAGLPAGHPAIGELRERLHQLTAALARHQRDDGLWTTIIDAPDSYRESTLAAMVAAALPHAFATGLLDPGDWEPLYVRARDAMMALIDDDGALALVSDATPVGEAATYATRPFGIFPWGQGPLLLALTRYRA